MFKRFALGLLAAALISAPVLAQAPAPNAPAAAPAAADNAKPAKHVHSVKAKGHGHAKHMKKPMRHAKGGKGKAKKPAAAPTTGAAKPQ